WQNEIKSLPIEDRPRVDGIFLDNAEIVQAETRSNRPCCDETQAAGIEGNYLSVRVDRGVEVRDEAVPTANIEHVGWCEIQVGDGCEIRTKGIPPPAW